MQKPNETVLRLYELGDIYQINAGGIPATLHPQPVSVELVGTLGFYRARWMDIEQFLQIVITPNHIIELCREYYLQAKDWKDFVDENVGELEELKRLADKFGWVEQGG